MRVTDVLLAEHAVFYAQFAECERTMPADDLASLQRCAAMIACALASHAQLEDDLLFRTLDRQTEVQPTILMVMRQEHDAIESGLTEIQSTLDVARARYLLDDVLQNARSHFAKEEHVLFPLANGLLSVAQQAQLVTAWANSRGVHVAAP